MFRKVPYIIAAILMLQLSAYLLNAQEHSYSGTVRDSADRSPLAGVFINCFSSGTSAGFVISDNDGRFAISTASPVDRMDFSMMGYKTAMLSSPPSGKDMSVLMTVQTMALTEITITPQIRTTRGDTVIYNASSFTQSTDNTLSQVLVRLPGVTVSNTGTIQVEGRNINKFYIEGMDLLESRYGIAVNNLKPEDIASIEIFHNHQPVKMLRKTGISRDAAVNIRLKESARSKWIFSVEAAAGGIPFIYRGAADAMAFNRTSQSIFLIKSNNSGDNITRELARQRLGTGVFLVNELGSGIPDLFSTSGPVLQIPDKYYFDNLSSAASANQIWKTAKDDEIKYSLSVTGERLDYTQSSSQSIIMPDSSTLTVSDADHLRKEMLHINGDVGYTSNQDESYIEEKLTFEIDLDRALSNISNKNRTYTEDYSLPKFYIGNTFKTIFRTTGGFVTFSSDTYFRKREQSMTVSSDTLITIIGASQAVQKIMMEEFSSDNSFSFSRKFRRLRLSIDAGLDILYSHLTSSLCDTAVNDIPLTGITPYAKAGIDYSIKGFRLSFNLPVSARTDISRNTARFYPTARPALDMEYAFPVPLTVKFTASVGNEAGDITDLAGNCILSSYRSMSARGRMERTLDQNYRLSLDYNNLAGLMSVSMSGYWRDHRSSLSLSRNYTGEDILSLYIDSPSYYKTAGAALNLQKRFGLNIFSTSLHLNYFKNWSSTLLQQSLYEYASDNLAANLKLGWTPGSRFELTYNIGVNASYLHTLTSAAPIISITNKVSAAATPVRNLSITADFYHILQRQSGYEDISLPFLDIRISYQIQKVGIFIDGLNLTGTDEFRRTYISSISTIHSITSLRGREFLAGVSVRF